MIKKHSDHQIILLCMETQCLEKCRSVTLSCPTSGMLPQSACHWLTHNFQNHSLPLIGWHSLLLILFSHQPRPAAAVHWTCSVATWIVGLSGTNFPSHFVPKIKSVLCIFLLHDCLTNWSSSAWKTNKRSSLRAEKANKFWSRELRGAIFITPLLEISDPRTAELVQSLNTTHTLTSRQ